jgi:hypothetical protein
MCAAPAWSSEGTMEEVTEANCVPGDETKSTRTYLGDGQLGVTHGM